jgi:hypothetical protein
VGPKISADLALTPEQITQVRKFVVNMRAKLPIAIVDAYYDHNGQALCPMANGISHHISPTGAIEPCPIIQFAKESVRTNDDLFDVFTKSEFLRDFRNIASANTRGCIVLERPDLVKAVVTKHTAKDSTIRQTAMAEIESMTPRTSQWREGEEIPRSTGCTGSRRSSSSTTSACTRISDMEDRPPACQPDRGVPPLIGKGWKPLSIVRQDA